MRWKIDIQSVTITNTSGAQTETTQSLHQVWAKKEDSSRVSSGSDERLEDMQVISTSTAFFTIRYISGLTTEMQIESESKIYDILSLEEIGFRDQIKIRAIYRSNS